MSATVVQRGTVASLIWRYYGNRRHATKMLARDAGVSLRTAEKWREGRCEPNGQNLLTLMARCAPLRDDIFRMTADESMVAGADDQQPDDAAPDAAAA